MLLSYPVNPVKISFLCRKVLFAFSLALLLVGPLRTGIALEVDQLPGETLGFVVVSDLGQFDASLRQLLKPWGLRFAGVEPTLAVVCPELSLAKRPLLMGLAETNAELTPFLLLPVDDLDALAEAIHADRAGDELIATVAGYDLKITPIAGGVRVSPLGVNLFTDPTDSLLAELKPLLGDAVAAVRATDFGLERIASQMHLERGHNRPSRPQLLHIRSLADLWSARSLLPAYAPLMKVLSREAKSLTIHIQAPDAESLRLSCEAILEEAPNELVSVKENSLPSIKTLAGEREPIYSLEASQPIPRVFTQLVMAWTESRPHEVDADRFAPREFAAYAKAFEEFSYSVTCSRSVTAVPSTGEALVANQAMLFRVRPGTPLVKLASEVVIRLNDLIRASDAGTPLQIELIPLASGGIRLRTDVVAALGGTDIEGLLPFMEKLYGPQGVRIVDYLPLGDGEHWLSSALPEEETTKLLQRLRSEQEAVETRANLENGGEIRIDRWFTWKQQIENLGHTETIGRRVRPPMREALPLQFVLSSEEDRVAIQLRFPVETYEALAEYWRAEKVAVAVP